MPFRFDWDGHVHSGLCPHGSGHPTRDYIERAIQIGLKRISILEHYPLPPGFPVPQTRLPVCFGPEMVDKFLEETLKLRDEYSDKIEVLVGFEWDFHPGREDWLREQLDRVGPLTQDSMLSVHYLEEGIINETAEFFNRDVLPRVGGDLDKAYTRYYEVLLQAVEADLGMYKPKRLGHLNLIRKFQRAIPAPDEYREKIMRIVSEVQSRGMQLDFNMSGLRKPLCQEPYLPLWLIRDVAERKLDIELVYGSDAHAPSEVGWGLEEAKTLVRNITNKSPEHFLQP